MKPLVIPPDAEHLVVDYLTAALAGRGQDATVGVDIPTAWVSSSKPYVQVALDGTPVVVYPILWRATVRVTAWASSPTAAKSLAALAQGLLLSHPGGGGFGSIRPLTGVLPARDPATSAQLASVTVQANLTGTALT